MATTRARRVTKKEVTQPEIDLDAQVIPLNPEVAAEDLEFLKECSEHSTDDGRPLLFFLEDMKPSDVLREAVDVVVAENNARLATGGFHKDLIFRNGKDSGQFVTLAKDDEGRVVVKDLASNTISLALQSRFCYLVGAKRKHKPMPGWFAGALNYGDTEYRFPVLNGMLDHPAIHLDGTVVYSEGYDPITKCWVTSGWEDLDIPTKPTAENVEAAITTLRQPFEEVIFVGDTVEGSTPVKSPGAEMTASEANTLGLILTTFLREQMAIAPLFVVTSVQWGTAKGLVASIASEIEQGHGPVLTDMKESSDQQEKNIDRLLIDHPGARILQFDEPQETGTSGKFHSRKLALLATSDSYVNRPVFGRKAVKVSTRRTMVFTGNSMRPDKDMVRRVSVIELDVPHDGTLPHERSFKNADRANKVLLLRWVKAQRREMISAVITLVNAWREAGCPEADFEFDFPEWTHIVGGILQSACVSAWMSNRNSITANSDEAMRTQFVLGLTKLVGVGPIITRDIVKKLVGMSDFASVKDLLMWTDAWATKLYTSWGDEEAMTYNLGRLLGSVKGRLLSDGNGGRVTVNSYTSFGRPQWTFTVPGQPAPVKGTAGRKPTTP